ncbi:MAG: N-6 DNA methylase, partial [Bacteroidetes bacterium]|nr:N-6 DNA methylase [Bacteroidota bacterium]
NIVFTDYLKFVFYRGSEFINEVRIANITSSNRIKPIKDNYETFFRLMQDFLSYKTEDIKSPEHLTERMVSKAHSLREVILDNLKEEKSELQKLFKYFSENFIENLDKNRFADLYTQTIVYGLFAARINYQQSVNNNEIDKEFNSANILDFFPKSNPFSFNLFRFEKYFNNNSNTDWIINDLIDLYSNVDLLDILSSYNNKYSNADANDPIIYFYENFLAKYNPEARKELGVWYTPKPIVRFIIKAIDDILKKEFKLNDGLLENIQILDPATGTGTFLVEMIRYMYSIVKEKKQEGSWNSLVSTNIIPRLNGFELLMVSYTIAHLKLEMVLKETGYDFSDDERLNIYLTDSLAGSKNIPELPYMHYISEENNNANQIKENPIMVVLGNPPYNNNSKNHDEWIEEKIQDYKLEPNSNKKLLERKLNLDDDYVKFIRLGEYFIERNKCGIVAYINPHGFLDNTTFRGMRWDLINTFDKIYTLNLHGNLRKQEKTAENTIDQNVFDIQQGVSINIFVKNKNKPSEKLADVFYFDLYGRREEKLKILDTNTINTINWTKIEYTSPYYFFAPKDFSKINDYEDFFALDNLFNKNVSGIKTARDNFTLYFNEIELKNAIDKFISVKDDEEARSIFNIGNDSSAWEISKARKDLELFYPNKGSFIKIDYRPFDYRYTFYTGKGCGFHQRARYDVMQHILNSKGDNIGLCLYDKIQDENTYQHVIISDSLIECHLLGSWAKLFPLYLYTEDGYRIPNIKDKNIIKEIENKTGLKFTSEKEENDNTFAPIDLMDFIYAVLHCPNYRNKYIEFLKIEFPKIPYPKNQEEFKYLINIGSKLRNLHLLKSDTLNEFITEYKVSGSDEITKVRYSNNRVYINEEQYFDNVPEEIWNFKIGSYQPAQT